MSFSLQQIQDYENRQYETRQPALIACTVIGSVFALCAVFLKLYARHVSSTTLNIDDVLIVASLAPLVGYAIVIYYGLSVGLGKHFFFVTDARGIVLVSAFLGLNYAFATVLTKGSILYFYCRNLPGKHIKRLSWVIIVFALMYNFSSAIIGFAQCIPLSAAWGADQGKCINLSAAGVCLGIVNVLVNITILSIPIRHVVSLKIDLTHRVLIGGIFLIGLIVCIFSIVRVAAVSTLKGLDKSYILAWIAVASFCEMFLGIIAASLPTLQPLFAKVLSHDSETFEQDVSGGRSSKRAIQTPSPIVGQLPVIIEEKPTITAKTKSAIPPVSRIPPVPKLPPIPKLLPIPIQSPVGTMHSVRSNIATPATTYSSPSPAPTGKVATTVRMARPQQRPKLTSKSLRARSRERARRAKRKLDVRIPSCYIHARAQQSNPDFVSVAAVRDYQV